MMRTLYGSLEQVLWYLRDANYDIQGVPLTVIPEFASKQTLQACIENVLQEKFGEELFRISLHYVSAVSRSGVTVASMLEAQKIVPWLVENIYGKKVATFSVVVKTRRKVNRDANVYLFTTV